MLVMGSVIEMLKNFFLKYSTELILILGTATFVIPIMISVSTGWEIPGILIFYDFIYGFIVLILLFNATDNKYYEQEGGYNNYHGYQSPTINKTYGYSNTFFSPINREKERNGGFTDKEVQIRKQLIRKRLEKKKLLDTKVLEKEEVTTNE